MTTQSTDMLKPLFWRSSQKECIDTQSTYFSQPLGTSEYSQPFRDSMRKLEGGGAAPVTAGGYSQEMVSQDSGLGTAAGQAPRTKSELLERRISAESQHRRQLEKDVRQALTHVAAHVSALPDKWQHMCEQLKLSSDCQSRRCNQQLAEMASTLTHCVQQLSNTVNSSSTEQKQAVSELCRCANHMDASVDKMSRSLTNPVESALQHLNSSLSFYSEQLECVVKSTRELHETTVSQLKTASAQLLSVVTDLPAHLEKLIDTASSHLVQKTVSQLKGYLLSVPSAVPSALEHSVQGKLMPPFTASSSPKRTAQKMIVCSKDKTSVKQHHSDTNVYDFDWDGWLSPLPCVRVSTTTSVYRKKRVCISPCTPQYSSTSSSVMGTPLLRSVPRSVLTSSAGTHRWHRLKSSSASRRRQIRRR